MKNKISENIRYVSLLLCICLMAFSGCVMPAKNKQHVNSAKRIDVGWTDENGNTSQEQFTIIELDSCEYIVAEFARSRMITHKGNCKFCTERSNKK